LAKGKKAMRKALFWIGIIALLLGVVWIGQGTGYFPYPPESFMIDETPWAWRGLVLAVVGLAVILVARRR
jgi:hypothetical protein